MPTLDLNNRFIRHFIDLVHSWNAAGFAEYMLWRAAERQPVGIWAFQEIVSDEIMEVLYTLRDDFGIWLYWSEDINSWEVVSASVWRAHAATVTLNELIARFRQAA